MGIVNVTPDSFSDGGRWFGHDEALAHARSLLAQGAGIIDVGGESTRPGAPRVEQDEEIRRVVPVVRALADEGVCVSVDTMHAATAEASIAAGARIINDVSGGKADPAMLPLVAEAGVDFVLMHWRGHSETMQELAQYDDVVADVIEELLRQRDAALAAGIDGDRIVLDPGLGFSKTAEHNWEALRRLDEFQRLGHRVLVGASRKRFLSVAADRDVATAVLSAWSAYHDVWAVRTHEVPCQRDALTIGALLRRR